MNYLYIYTLGLSLFMGTVYAVEPASEERIDEVVRRGGHVMPFDLELTLHIFSKSPNGGVQRVIVKNVADTQQIKKIREHLTKISHEFQQRDFSGPEKIHGSEMPGLEALRKAKMTQINIGYKDLSNGAEIIYSTESPKLITAIHQWFDAQLRDHAHHAVSGNAHHKMHYK